jgi:predicted transcriptional regulator
MARNLVLADAEAHMARMTSDTPPQSDNVIPLPLTRKAKRRAEDKWSPQVLKLGYTPLPNLLLRAQGKLKITPVQLNVLVQLAEHWWEADKDPYPAKERIATRMGKSPRMVQRYLTQLEKAGLIKRIQRYSGRKAQTSNAYSLEGLVKKLRAIEPEFSKLAEQTRLKRNKLEAATSVSA